MEARVFPIFPASAMATVRAVESGEVVVFRMRDTNGVLYLVALEVRRPPSLSKLMPEASQSTSHTVLSRHWLDETNIDIY